HIERSLTKSERGDRIVFEEQNKALGIGFRYEWVPSEEFGWVRRAELWSLDGRPQTVDILDGLLDILPAGVDLITQQRASNLIDAYRHTEVHESSAHLAIYSMASLLTDRAEPAEALRANIVWRTGLPGKTHLSAEVIKQWRRGQSPPIQTHLRGKKGAYLLEASVSLKADLAAQWSIVADVALDSVAMTKLRRTLDQNDLGQRLGFSIDETARGLARLVAAVDGPQRTGDRVVTVNHLSNALFNGLRGGVFVDECRVPRDELLNVVRLRHRAVAKRHADWIKALPDALNVSVLREKAASQNDPDLSRLVDETLPLSFGRRHGDPSRPWNTFSIRTRHPDGTRALNYEGNWRDIFQNWEALAFSYPDFLPSMIAKFVNASTVDGFNPYRLSKTGIDWEVPDLDDPWSNIGYWGDHQIIYSLRLLEALRRYRPNELNDMLDDRRFSFGDVPYRVCAYEEMLANPRDTIRFDEDKEAAIAERTRKMGQDGRLVQSGADVAHTHLWEKLLIPLLSKLSCLVVD
ncbi:MAG: hypothetical protein AAF449_24755, partial [Myxococcota bacterium]